MKLVGLTGSIASGKTTLLWEFARLGFPTLDCDAVVHRLYFEPEVQTKIMKKFNSLDKKTIAERVFSNATDRKWLEKLLHPLVWREIKAWSKSFGRPPPLAFVEVPLLFEINWEKRFDVVILVKNTDEKRVQLALARGLSPDQAKARLKTQVSDKAREKKASIIVENSGSVLHLRQKAIEIVRDLA
jgi:dephospho-CoA kinase